MHLNLMKLRKLIREEIETFLDDQEMGVPSNRPDQNVREFEDFRGYVANTMQGTGAHSGLVDSIRGCDVGHPIHDTLWNTWSLIEPECSAIKDGVPYAGMGQIMWPYADGMARDVAAVHIEDGGDPFDVDEFSGQFCGALGCDATAQPAVTGGIATFDDLGADGARFAELDAPAADDEELLDDDGADDLLNDDEAFVDEDRVLLDPLGDMLAGPDVPDDEEEDDEEELDDEFDALRCEICGKPLDHGICNDCD